MFVEPDVSRFSQRMLSWGQIWFVQIPACPAANRWLPDLWSMERPRQAQDRHRGSNGQVVKIGL